MTYEKEPAIFTSTFIIASSAQADASIGENLSRFAPKAGIFSIVGIHA